MAMLHTVNKSPTDKNSLGSCIRLAKAGSSVLLIEDGVYGAIKGSSQADMVSKAMQDLSIYVLGPDVKARGVAEDKLLDGIKVVDYAGFVDLVTEHETTQSWL